MEKLITIVIPTYNMEKYLDKCLTSLIVPDEYMELLEVLVVNDGSKDNSSAIAHRYEDKYPQTFRVIDKENGNYGSCVNRGLKEAAGKYIKILDADDSFDNQNWKVFMDKLKKTDADLILTDYDLVDENGIIKESRTFDIVSNRILEVLEVIRPLAEIEMHAITYRRSVLLDMKYHQSEGISYTDTEWSFIPFMNLTTVCYFQIKIYNYLVGRNGQTMAPDVFLKKFDEMLCVRTKLLDFCTNHNLFYSEKSLFYRHRLLGFYIRTYTDCLIKRNLPIRLSKIDEDIKNRCPDFYQELDRLQFSRFAFVHLWRKYNYKLPIFYTMLIRIIYWKRRNFPRFSLLEKFS